MSRKREPMNTDPAKHDSDDLATDYQDNLYGIRGWLLGYLIVVGLNFLWLIVSIRLFADLGLIVPWSIIAVFVAGVLLTMFAEKPWVRTYQISFNLIFAALALMESPLVSVVMVVCAAYWFFSKRAKRTYCGNSPPPLLR